jgi:hypothetical protein
MSEMQRLVEFILSAVTFGPYIQLLFVYVGKTNYSVIAFHLNFSIWVTVTVLIGYVSVCFAVVNAWLKQVAISTSYVGREN